MQFRIADTFTASLALLRNDEQKAVETTVFDLQLDPANPGMRFDRIDRSRDPNFLVRPDKRRHPPDRPEVGGQLPREELAEAMMPYPH